LIERTEATLFLTFMSGLYERVSIIVTCNKGFDFWVELLRDKVMTTDLLNLLLHHTTVFSCQGSRIASQ